MPQDCSFNSFCGSETLDHAAVLVLNIALNYFLNLAHLVDALVKPDDLCDKLRPFGHKLVSYHLV